jgi:hypothetical protein
MYQFVIKASWITGDRLMFQNQLMDTKIAIHLDLNW